MGELQYGECVAKRRWKCQIRQRAQETTAVTYNLMSGCEGESDELHTIMRGRREYLRRQVQAIRRGSGHNRDSQC